MIGAFYAKDSKSTTSRRVFLSHDAVLHSFIAPKARRREHGVNFQRNYLPCIEPYETILSNVKGDGRCGYRALALWLQTTVEDVMKTLAEIMVKEPRTTVTDCEIINMLIASDVSNPCPQSCWLSHAYLQLLARGATRLDSFSAVHVMLRCDLFFVAAPQTPKREMEILYTERVRARALAAKF